MKKDGNLTFNPINNNMVFHRSVFAMNTRLDLVFCEIESTLSRFDPESELFLLNKTAFSCPVHVSDAMISYLTMANHYYVATSGFFDVSSGSIFNELKTDGTVKSLTTGNFNDRVSINFDEHSVQLLQHDTLLDFGGMGKGIALDAVANIIDSYTIENAFISFGGSSVLTRGHHPHGKYWPFSLINYPSRVWELNDSCISVSSAYQSLSDKKAIHICNPYHPELVLNDNTVVVQCHNPIDAEIVSTSLIAAPVDVHAIIMANFKEVNYSFVNTM